MDKRLFSITDISEDILHDADRYLKKVIINAKYHYYRRQNYKDKYGIIFVDLDDLTEELGREDDGYESVLCQYIEVKETLIPVFNPNLAAALQSLTELQRLVLLEHVCLDVSLKDISRELNISERMVRKHKHNAIESIRRRMQKDEEV